MTTHVLSIGFYVGIFAILVALTIATLGVSLLPIEGAWHVVAGLSIGVAKASLVVLFFMHARDSPKLTWIVILVAIAWLAILFGLTLCDYLTRGWILGMPGH